MKPISNNFLRKPKNWKKQRFEKSRKKGKKSQIHRNAAERCRIRLFYKNFFNNHENQQFEKLHQIGTKSKIYKKAANLFHIRKHHMNGPKSIKINVLKNQPKRAQNRRFINMMQNDANFTHFKKLARQL